MPRLLVLFAFLLLLTGCRSTAPAAVDVEADRAAILAQSRRFSEAYVAGDIATLVGIYAEDGVAAPGGRDFIRGHAALETYWGLPEGRTILRHVAIPVELVIDGDHAYDWGTYEGQAAQDGTPLDPFDGKYVIVWARGTDGVWRMAMDMWNRLPAPEGD